MMSKIFNLYLPLLILGLFFFSGCQEEVTEIIDPETNEAFTPVSPVADLVQRTSQNDGSDDNIVDGSSCSSLVLPVTVIVNGEELTINSKDDFYTVEHIIDRYNDDDDEIEIVFPVTVILADYSERILNNEDDLEDLVDQCPDNGFDDDIECVDFKYPLSISIYDSENELSKVITIDNDKELYTFIHDLEDTDFASFNFPITVVLSDSTEMVIKDNDELEDILKNAIDACDEDDDNDHDDDDMDDSDLVKVIVNGDWAISYFFNESDKTTDFAGYVFTFMSNGVAKAKKGDMITMGEWDSNGDDGALEIEFEFEGNSLFDELHEDWEIIEYDSIIIKLKEKSSGHGSESYLTFERPIEDDGGNGAPAISDAIVDGLWIVSNYNDSGEDETTQFAGYDLDFSTDGTVSATKDSTVLAGKWSTKMDEGAEKFVLDFGMHAPFDELNEDWDIVEAKEARIELKDVGGSDGLTDKLILEKKL